MNFTIKDFISLTKFYLSLAVSLSSLFAFILAKEGFGLTMIPSFLAVLLLALGVSALNQYQEYEDDAKMQRTRNRPIASKKISPNTGLTISLVLIAIAYIVIYFVLDFLGIVIFSSVIILYNLIYTKIKKVTVYAAVYGAILGTIPPLVGWISGGGDIKDIRFLTIALFYFVWQIPHFWLLVLKYHKQYSDAGFATVADKFGVQRLERITFIWLLFTLTCGVFTVSLFSLNSTIIILMLIVILFYSFYSFVLLMKEQDYLKAFMGTNIFITSVMLLLSINVFL